MQMTAQQLNVILHKEAIFEEIFGKEYTIVPTDEFNYEIFVEHKRRSIKHLDSEAHFSDALVYVSLWLNSGYDIRPYYRNYSLLYLEVIRQCFIHDMDYNIILNSGYDKSQIIELLHGLWHNVDIIKYLDYDAFKMKEIRLGLEHKIDIDLYNSGYSTAIMKEIRLGLEHGVDIRDYILNRKKLGDVTLIRESLERGLDISKCIPTKLDTLDRDRLNSLLVNNKLIVQEGKIFIKRKKFKPKEFVFNT